MSFVCVSVCVCVCVCVCVSHQASALQAAIEADKAAGLIPFWVLATIGTTSTCAVDPVTDIAAVARAQGTWLHVDAAYAGSAAVCPHQRSLWFQGLEV